MVVLAFLARTVAAPAAVDDGGTLRYRIAEKPGSTDLECTVVKEETSVTSGDSKVVVSIEVADSLTDLSIQRAKSGNAVLQGEAGAANAFVITSVPSSGEIPFELEYVRDGGSATWLSCKQFELPGPDPDGSQQTSRDPEAALWWRDHGAAESRRIVTKLEGAGLGRPFGRRLRARDRRDVTLLVHLPSGAPASPFPSSIREGTIVQAAVLVPVDEAKMPLDRDRSYTMAVKSCARVDPFRTTLDAEEAEGETNRDGKAQGDEPAPKEFVVVPIGPWLRCGAGDLEYELAANDPPSESATDESAGVVRTEIRVRPVYHLAAVAIPGFDTACLPSFGLQSRDDGNGGTEQIIQGGRSCGDAPKHLHDRAGASVMVGGQWMIGGIDYEDLRWYNYFANVFVAVDAARPLDAFVSGLALTPTGGLSLAIGVSVHKTQRLGGNLRVGDVFTGNGEIPTVTNWHKPSVGAFIGISIDHRVYQAFTARFKK